MKFLKTSALIIFLFALQQNVNAQLKNLIKQFDFMLGDWQMKTSNGSIIETWRKNKNGMTGKSYRHEAKGRLVLTERVELKLTNDIFNFSVTGFDEGNKEQPVLN